MSVSMISKGNRRIETNVSVNEDSYFKVRDTIIKRGYLPANSIGFVDGTLPWNSDHDSIGIIEPRTPTEKKILFGLIKTKKDRSGLHIGTLWFDNYHIGAQYHKRWILEAYGREKIPSLKNLSTELTQIFKVNIDIKLKSEFPELEKVLGQYEY